MSIDERPEIYPGNRIHTTADAVLKALVDSQDPLQPEVALRGCLVYPDISSAGPVLRDFTKQSMRYRMSEVMDWFKDSKDGWMQTKVPADDADLLLHLPQLKYLQAGVPRIDTVTQTPFFVRGEGGKIELVSEPGYHAATRTLLLADSSIEPVTDVTPFRQTQHEKLGTCEEWQLAREVILDALADFPFVEEADRAHAIGLMLLPFVRMLINGPTPMHAIQAPTPGSGKGLLAMLCMMPSFGPGLPSSVFTGDDVELEKRITAALLAGPSVVFLDNLAIRLDSAALNMALTQPVWKGRILGLSKMAELPIKNAWICTANNLQTTREAARRIVPIFLDPQTEAPDLLDGPATGPRAGQKFLHDPLDLWAEENRHMLRWACLTLIRTWSDEHLHFEHGERGTHTSAAARTMGSYKAYIKVIGGILDAISDEHHELGEAFLRNHDKLVDVSTGDDVSEWVEFMETIHQTWPDGATSATIADAALVISGKLPHDLQFTADKLREKLPYWMRAHRNQIHGGWKLVGIDGGRTTLWSAARTG